MAFEKISGYFDSTNGTDRVAYYIYEPASAPRMIVQIVHGMCEYLERYEDFAGFLCSNGILVCGHDHLGHGKTAGSPEKLGYFAPERGWQFLAKDTVRLTRMIRDQYPGIPCFILGHSMGSLVTRTVLAKYSYLYDGAVLMGTLNHKHGTDLLLAGTKAAREIGDEYRRSSALDKLIFGLNNSRIENASSEFSWISRDEEIVEKYENDPYCTFKFTVSAYADLVFLVNYVSGKKWAEKLDKELPVYICSGDEDPIGSYGRAPKEVFNMLNDAGLTDIELKLYNGARHELLNETNRAEVYEDMLKWLDAHAFITKQ